jgi:hypothetical protein
VHIMFVRVVKSDRRMIVCLPPFFLPANCVGAFCFGGHGCFVREAFPHLFVAL